MSELHNKKNPTFWHLLPGDVMYIGAENLNLDEKQCLFVVGVKKARWSPNGIVADPNGKWEYLATVDMQTGEKLWFDFNEELNNFDLMIFRNGCQIW